MFLFPFRKSLSAALAAGAVFVLGFLLNLPCASGQNADVASASRRARIDEALKGMNRGKSVGQVAISPDGKRLAWVENFRDATEIRVAPANDLAKNERVTVAANAGQRCHEGEIAWEPDSKALAFFSDCADQNPQDGRQADLYLSRLDGSAVRRLTTLRGYADSTEFSPDGKNVAFLYVEGATRPAGALAAMKPPAGVIGEDGLEIQRVAVARIDVSAAAPAQVTPKDLHIYEFNWSPDSKGMAYVAGNPPGENNWWVAKLYTQTIGGQPQVVLAPSEVSGPLHGMQIAVPRWSPDGKAIAFIGGLMSDQGSTGGDVWIIPAVGGEPRDLSQGRPTSPAWMEWEGNEYLYVSELAGGNSQLIRYRLQGDRVSAGGSISFGAPIFSIPGTVGDGRMEMSLSSTADHSMFVFKASTFDRPVEIYAAKPGKVMSSGLDGVIQLSHLNDGVVPTWGKSVSLSWKSDSFRVQGWLILPKDYDPAKKYPLIVAVHGGPAAAQVSHWGGEGGVSATTLSTLGYFVFEPNPRGSFGQGEAFTQANRKDFGYGDLRDILAGVDAVRGEVSDRSAADWDHRLELRRVHEHVCGDADGEVQGGSGGSGNFELAELLWSELDRPVDDSLFWGVSL